MGLFLNLWEEPIEIQNVTAINLKNIILSSFQELEQIPLEDLLENRYNKFRKMGKFKTKVEGE